MRSRGFEAAPIAPEVEVLAMEDWRAKTMLGSQVSAVRTIRARSPLDSRDLLQALEETCPDALIVDVLAAGALNAAAAWNGPWSCYRPFPFPRSRIALKLLGIDRALSAARLHLYMSAAPFEYRDPGWPESVVMVGPCTWEPKGDLPAVLADVDEPLVLVTTSTDFQDDGRLVQDAVEGLADEPLHVVATLPSAELDDISVPDNATLLRFAAHSPILARAVCAITHGGMGATQKALALGVPVCAVPFGRDQPDVARRIKRAEAGSCLPASRLNPRRLRAKVEEAIACRAGAERLAKAFAQAGGPPSAADAIEQRLL